MSRSSGWAVSGRRRRTGWPGAGSASSASSSSSWVTCAAPRTTTRASSAARTTRPSTCGWPPQAYDAWRAVEAESRQRMITITGGIDLFPPDAAIDHRTYTASPRRRGRAVRVDRRCRDAPPLAGVRRRRAGHRRRDGRVLAADRHRARRPGTRVMQQLARARGATLRGNTPVRAIRPVGGEVDIVTDDGVTRVGSVVITADAWTNRLLAILDLQIPLAVIKEQVSYFPQADLDAVRRRPLPGVDLDGRPQLLRLPRVRRHDGGEGLPRTAAAARSTPTRARSTPTPRWRSGCATFMQQLVGGGFGRPAHDDVSLHAHLGSRLRARPAARLPAGVGRARRGARLQVRVVVRAHARRSGVRRGCRAPSWPRSRSPAPSLHAPIDRAAWMV